jgi:hypothetical protein
MARKSPKETIKIRRLAVGDRARMPSTVAGFVGAGERRSIIFDVPGWTHTRLTIPAHFVPGADGLEDGDPVDLGCRVTKLEGEKAAVRVDGFAPAPHLLGADKLKPGE